MPVVALSPYRSTHRSSDCDETSTSCCKHAHGGFEHLKTNVCLSVPYRSTDLSYDCDETFTSCCKHAHGGFGNLKKK